MGTATGTDCCECTKYTVATICTMIETDTTGATSADCDGDVLTRGHAIIAVVDQPAGAAPSATISCNRRPTAAAPACHYQYLN